jgi:hypothetical protein
MKEAKTRNREHNPIIPNVSTPTYEGLCRRKPGDIRFSVLEVVCVDDENPNEDPYIAKCTNLSDGGCKIISQKPLNKSAIVMLSFYHQEGDEIIANVPLTAKVVDVHQLKNKMFRINADARGVIHEPHGIERILLGYAKKLLEEKEK